MQMSSPFRECMEQAFEEAKRRGDARLGTDHVLLGALHDPRGSGLVGADVADARSAMDRLDLAALAAVGIDTDVPFTASRRGSKPRWSVGAQQVLRESVRDAKLRRAKVIDVASVLRSLLDRPAPDPAHELLAEIGVDADVVRTRLVAA